MDLIDWWLVVFGVLIAAGAFWVVKQQYDIEMDEINRDIGWRVMWHERDMNEHDG